MVSDPNLLVEMISQLPKPKQRFVMEVIENMLAQQGR
jgi:hypothetical protein